jgi:hypothetical protein
VFAVRRIRGSALPSTMAGALGFLCNDALLFHGKLYRARSKPVRWEIIKIKASPAQLIGHVFATNENAALKIAIEQFQVREVDRRRLMVRRA